MPELLLTPLRRLYCRDIVDDMYRDLENNDLSTLSKEVFEGIAGSLTHL